MIQLDFGDEEINDPITFEAGGVENGVLSGTFRGERFSGTFRFSPVPGGGDCATKPFSHGRVTGEGVLVG